MTGVVSIGWALGVVVSPLIYETTGSWPSTVAMFSIIGWIGIVLAGWKGMFIYPSANDHGVSNCPPPMAGKMIGLYSGLGEFGRVAGLYPGGLSVARSGSFKIAITVISVAAAAGVIMGCLARHCERTAA